MSYHKDVYTVQLSKIGKDIHKNLIAATVSNERLGKLALAYVEGAITIATNKRIADIILGSPVMSKVFDSFEKESDMYKQLMATMKEEAMKIVLYAFNKRVELFANLEKAQHALDVFDN